MYLKQRLNIAGDTIVEVLIATTILGFVIGGAYSLTSRSLQISRAAQERIEALKFVEGQLEQLKYQARTDPNFNANFRTGSAFCFQQDTGAKKAAGAPDCQVGPSGRYTLSISYVNNSAFINPNKRLGTFNVRANWASIVQGSPTQQLIINYQT